MISGAVLQHSWQCCVTDSAAVYCKLHDIQKKKRNKPTTAWKMSWNQRKSFNEKRSNEANTRKCGELRKTHFYLAMAWMFPAVRAIIVVFSSNIFSWSALAATRMKANGRNNNTATRFKWMDWKRKIAVFGEHKKKQRRLLLLLSIERASSTLNLLSFFSLSYFYRITLWLCLLIFAAFFRCGARETLFLLGCHQFCVAKKTFHCACSQLLKRSERKKNVDKAAKLLWQKVDNCSLNTFAVFWNWRSGKTWVMVEEGIDGLREMIGWWWRVWLGDHVKGMCEAMQSRGKVKMNHKIIIKQHKETIVAIKSITRSYDQLHGDSTAKSHWLHDHCAFINSLFTSRLTVTKLHTPTARAEPQSVSLLRAKMYCWGFSKLRPELCNLIN